MMQMSAGVVMEIETKNEELIDLSRCVVPRSCLLKCQEVRARVDAGRASDVCVYHPWSGTFTHALLTVPVCKPSCGIVIHIV